MNDDHTADDRSSAQRQKRLDDAGELADNGAKVADQLLGRGSGTATPLDEVASISMDAVIPRSPTSTMLNRHVTAGAAMVAGLALLFGGGSVAGVVTPLMQSAAGKATVGSYISFIDAFFLTFALSVAAAVVVFAVRSNRLSAYPLAAVAIAACIGSVLLAQEFGLASPSLADMQAGIGHGNPIAQAFGGFGVFFAFYGPIPFLAGAVVGGLVGNIAHNLAKSSSA